MSLMVIGERRGNIYAMHLSSLCRPWYTADNTLDKYLPNENQECMLALKSLTEYTASNSYSFAYFCYRYA